MKDNPTRQLNRPSGGSGRQALDAAFRLLTRRDHARGELAAKLRHRGFDPPDIENALARCEELGYLDDAKTAMTMAGHLADRGYGSLRIRHFLSQKGLDPALIEKAMACGGDEGDQVERARQVLDKKSARLQREPDPWKRRQAAYRFLAGRGFPSMVIERVLADM